MEGMRKISLLGQPNAGKSTIFNTLTGMHQHVGNWPGKTIDTDRLSKMLGIPVVALVAPEKKRYGVFYQALEDTYRHPKAIDFSGLYALYKENEDDSFEKHLNQYNVISLNMQEFFSQTHDVQGMKEQLEKEVLWDCIFRENQNNLEAQKLYLDFLRNLLKDKIYVKLAYMTGILPIKKYGSHSALKMG